RLENQIADAAKQNRVESGSAALLVKALIEQLDQRLMAQAEKGSAESVAHAKALAGLDLRIADLVASGCFNSLEASTSANVLGGEFTQRLAEQVDRSIAAVTLS